MEHNVDKSNTSNSTHSNIHKMIETKPPSGGQASVGRARGWKVGGIQHDRVPARKKAIEIAFRNFPDGTRLRLISDPSDSMPTRFAVSHNGSVELRESFEYGQDAFEPPHHHDDPLFRAITLPGGVQPHGKPSDMATETGRLISELVPLNEREQILYGAFAVLTWVCEKLPLSPTIVIRGPRDLANPLLQALGLFCRYGLVIGDATPAGLFEARARICPTLLIADYGIRSDSLRQLEIGSWPGIGSLQKHGVFSMSGPRVIACGELILSGDLVPGGVVVPLSLSGWPNLERLRDPQFLDRADCLRQQMLDFDLERGGSIRRLGTDKPRHVNPRRWEAYCSWGAPFAGDTDYLQRLYKAISEEAELCPDGLRPDRYAVLSALMFLVHEEPLYAAVGKISELANIALTQMGEEICLTDRKVGAILTNLGFPRRERGGDDGPYTLEFTMYVKRFVHGLATLYGYWKVQLDDTEEKGVICKLCREEGRVSNAEMVAEHPERCEL